MTHYDTSRSLTRGVLIYDSPSVVEYHGIVNSTKLLILRSVDFCISFLFQVVWVCALAGGVVLCGGRDNLLLQCLSIHSGV